MSKQIILYTLASERLAVALAGVFNHCTAYKPEEPSVGSSTAI